MTRPSDAVPLEFQVWDARDCADYLKESAPYFLRVTRCKDGFPPPLPNFKQPRWSAIAVIKWALRS